MCGTQMQLRERMTNQWVYRSDWSESDLHDGSVCMMAAIMYCGNDMGGDGGGER